MQFSCPSPASSRISGMKPGTWTIITIVGLTVTLTIFNYAEFIATSTGFLPQLSQILDIKEFYPPNIEITINSVSYQSNSTEEEEDYKGLMPSCVPSHEYIFEQANHTKNDGNSVKTPIVLLAAFEYESHISVTFQNDGYHGIQVFCHYFSDDLKSLGPASSGYGFPQHVFSCCKKEGAKFIGVTVDRFDAALQVIPITRRLKTPEYNFSLCLCPIYGNTSTWLLLTELIEHYKLQGVDHFYIYIQEMDSYSKKLLQSYIETGDVEAIYFSDKVYRNGDYWQTIGITDCVTRSRFHSKYIISQDLDERITPTQSNSTLREYIEKYFETHPEIGILSFRQRWILRDKIPPSLYKGKRTLHEHLPTINYHNTSGIAPPGHTAKNILDPLKVLSMWIHNADAMYSGYKEDYAPPEEFVIRHYRDVALSDWGTRWLPTTLPFGNYTNTFYPKNLQEKLFANVKRRLDKVYLRK